MPTEIPNTVTNEEIATVEGLGFSITAGTAPLKDFLNTQFTGLQFGEFLKAIDELLSPLTQVSLYKEVAYFERPPYMLLIQYYSEDSGDEQTGLALSRALIRQNEDLIADHDFFRLPVTARRLGIGKRLLNLCLQQYLRLGVDKIRLEATLENGGYVWARAFFTATEPAQVRTILKKAEQKLMSAQFKFVKRVYDNYYDRHPGGKAFPMVKWSRLAGMETILGSMMDWVGK